MLSAPTVIEAEGEERSRPRVAVFRRRFAACRRDDLAHPSHLVVDTETLLLAAACFQPTTVRVTDAIADDTDALLNRQWIDQHV